MKQLLVIALSALLLPSVAFAQATINTFLIGTLGFISGVLIPFLFGLAFLFFVINAVRYFIIQSDNEDGREKAKSLILYTVLAFVFLIIFWGLITVIVSGLGLEGCTAPMGDYRAEYFVGPSLPNCP